MLTDVEIARKTNIKPIKEVAKLLNIAEEEIEFYGKYKAKLSPNRKEPKGKLILVTAMNPTKFGEGKTTVSIGLADAIAQLGGKCCLALREPSLGPVFGVKGGACGGGYAQVMPMEEINLHFTGDFHAITAANNLLSALIDNHIKQGNSLGIANVTWRRCVDINDRALRNVKVALGGDINGTPRNDGFTITAASEIMAILCLSTSIRDLKSRLANVIIGYGISGEEITAGDLKAEESMTILLKEALKPNLVQTLEGTPALIHGGPFANIAHGCNSLVATTLALSLAQYTVTEAGFGADLGGEKFLNIKCRENNLNPACAVLVVTLRSIKFNANNTSDDTNLEIIKKGFANIEAHINNLTRKFKINTVIAINKFDSDNQQEIQYLQELCLQQGVEAIVTTCFSTGGQGAIELAQKVMQLCNCTNKTVEYTYSLEDSLEEKINKVAKNIYGASSVSFSNEAAQQLQRIQEHPLYSQYPICIAKTQFSLSADSTLLGAPRDFELHIDDIFVRAGAKFILVQCANILLMPGLPANPNALKMHINDDGEVFGLY